MTCFHLAKQVTRIDQPTVTSKSRAMHGCELNLLPRPMNEWRGLTEVGITILRVGGDTAMIIRDEFDKHGEHNITCAMYNNCCTATHLGLASTCHPPPLHLHLSATLSQPHCIDRYVPSSLLQPHAHSGSMSKKEQQNKTNMLALSVFDWPQILRVCEAGSR